jgi:hypothetical protein
MRAFTYCMYSRHLLHRHRDVDTEMCPVSPMTQVYTSSKALPHAWRRYLTRS